METADILKYGAMGLALAMAGLSYRLLTKEQDQEGVRPVMLKTIKVYFLMAVFLSVVFGVTEIVKLTWVKAGTSELAQLHQFHCVSSTATTAAAQKDSLDAYMKKLINDIDKAKEKERKLTRELKKAQSGGFYRHIAVLSSLQPHDKNINLDYQPEGKGEVFDVLNKIFGSLGLCTDNIESSKEITDMWKKLKLQWAPDDYRLKFIFTSDIIELVKCYGDIEGASTK